MFQKFEEHINKTFPFLKDKKLLVAISGGVDSVVLTHLLHSLKFDIFLAHCNFQLRADESNLDEKFVLTLGKKLGLQTFTKQFDTEKHAQKHKLSTQLSARKLRYDWFQELMENHQFDYVLTAHHLNDTLETFLINLTRGTGLEGLTGIPPQNGNIIRSLLIFSRDNIIAYAKANNIEWREDSSNSETKYIRNKIRHKIVPKLKEINPSLLSSFEKTSEYLQQSQQIVNDRIAEVSKKIISYDGEVVKFNIEKIKQLSNPKAYLFQFFKKYNFTEWKDVNNLLTAQSGKKIVSKNYILLKDRNFLLLSATNNIRDISNCFLIKKNTSTIKTPIHLIIKKTTEIGNYCKNSIFINKNLVIFPLILRKWSKGDYFFPTGMTGKKKVSKYFKDEKYSLIDKQNTWLLCSNNNEVIWIVGKRQDRRFIATKETKNIIKISI